MEDLTYNICDQKFHEFEIRKQNPDVFVIRKTLTEVADQGRLDDEKRLFIGKDEVAVIYFRYVDTKFRQIKSKQTAD